MVTFKPEDLKIPQIAGLMTGGIAPRPIAFVSTISKRGVKNLSPYSFFNAFGSNPPMIAFSPSNRGRDNTLKDTYNNIVDTGECVVNAVTYSMVDQMNLASCEYSTKEDEFIKSGFTPIESKFVKPKRVWESPFQIECKLHKMINLGDGPASGNLAICEVMAFHVAEHIMTDGKIDSEKIDHVGRNGANWYTRSYKTSLFEVPKPGKTLGMGFDRLPEYIKNSDIYTASNLARFALKEIAPTEIEVKHFFEGYQPLVTDKHRFWDYIELRQDELVLSSVLYWAEVKESKFLEYAAKYFIEKGDIEKGWIVATLKGIVFDA